MRQTKSAETLHSLSARERNLNKQAAAAIEDTGRCTNESRSFTQLRLLFLGEKWIRACYIFS